MNIAKLKFDENGLIPAVVQDAVSKEVLTVAYMNEESLKKRWKRRKHGFTAVLAKNFGIKEKRPAIHKLFKRYAMTVTRTRLSCW